MASCITAQWSGSVCPQVRLTVTSADVNGGTAKLSWTLEYVAHGYAADVSSARPYTVTINGVKYTGTYNIDGVSSTKTIRTGTLNVAKDTTSKTINFSVSFDFNLTWSGVYGGTKTASGSLSVSAKTKYTISYNANGGTGAPSSQSKWYGQAITLSTTKPTRVGYVFQGWGKSATTTTVSYDPGDTYSPNANATLYAVWKIITYTISYDANGGSGKPANQTKTYGKTLTLSSTIPTRSGYTFLGWSTSSTATSETWKAGGSYTVNASDVLYAVWKLAYSKPKISNYTVNRCDADGVADDGANGPTYAHVKFKWSTTNDVIKIEIFASSSEGTVSQEVSASGKSGSVDVILAFTLSAEVTWDIKVTVTDSGGSTSSYKSLPGFIIPFDVLNGGEGVSFGKPAELTDYADFGFKTRHRDHMYFDKGIYIYGTKPDGTSVAVVNTQNTNGDTYFGYGNYTSKSGNTSLCGNDVSIYVANIPTPRGFRPYFRAGDDPISVSINTAGYVTSGGTEVNFIVPLSKTVLGNPSVSAAGNSGFMLRQDGKYTHGCSSTTCCHPDGSPAYTCRLVVGIGVIVTAHFSESQAAINVVNNAPIGVYWSGTITLS